MFGKKEDDRGECSQTVDNINIQSFQEQLFLQQQQQIMLQHQQQNSDIYGGAGLIFPQVSPILQPWPLPPVHAFSPAGHFSTNPVRDHDPLNIVPPTPSSFAGLFNRRPPPDHLQFAYDDHGPSSDHLRIISDTLVPVVQPGSAPFGLQAELGKMTAQEILDAKALAASKSHSEAERRRRERINNHLAKLRSLLPNTTKTDKASLLAEVIEHVKELKRQTSLIAETNPVPTEVDELTVDTSDEDAEITTLGGRVKNVLYVSGDEDSISSSTRGEQQQQHSCISSIEEALKAVMEKTAGDESSSGCVKRQRTTNINLLEHS
ncbi:hypothetical protein CIPAW_16G002900 [Carya illinoinensis]|uniref:BHLH domain-containing protein n=1 Tax=Carya illinoinensis TaxID=32201 RepID=A0A8T1N2K5_CARIL|nr:hypothetical protein CIPAW_16G002900 [Carya illinoinensis]